MVIAHNLTTMNATRMFGINNSKIQTSIEKLSSGYRINRSADDAAGLAISEKMRAQIRGLNRASRNAQDGISVIQTAEGAFGEMQSMLHRINELCTQAANDTNTDTDRENIQQEIDQLVLEIEDTTERTQFNTKQILSGINKRDASGNNNPSAAGEQGKITYFTGKNNLNGNITCGSASIDIDEDTGEDGLQISLAGTVNGTLFGFMVGIGNVTQQQEDFAGNTEADYAAFSYKDRNGNSKVLQAIFSTKSTDPSVPALSASQLISQVKYAEQVTGFDWGADKYVDGFKGVEKAIRRERGEDIKSVEFGFDDRGAREIRVSTWSDTNDPFVMKLQVGSLSGQSIDISIDHLNARGLGINGLFVDTFEDAGKAMEKVQKAIDKVSTARASLGAQQNRLEHTIKNIDNVAENTQASESRIRDTNMAKEMVEYMKSQILMQASQAMIANSRRGAEGMLALLA